MQSLPAGRSEVYRARDTSEGMGCTLREPHGPVRVTLAARD